jgi:hypothetical protein
MKTILFALLVLSRVDGYRNAFDSFAVDVELTSTTPDGHSENSKFRVYGKGSDRSIVEFTAPQTEKGKYLLMLRDAMWIYMPSASRPIRISPLQRLMGQASNGDVARTSFTVDYTPTAIAEEQDQWVLEPAKDKQIKIEKLSGDLKKGGKLAGKISGAIAGHKPPFSWDLDFDLTLPQKAAGAGPGC